jgi:hypothetical protein
VRQGLRNEVGFDRGMFREDYGFKGPAHSIFERWSMGQNNLANIVDVICNFSWGEREGSDLSAAACYFCQAIPAREGRHEEFLELMPLFVCYNKRLGWNNGIGEAPRV